MSQRKLQQEMDRVFKKVSEGVQLFDSIYDKLMQSNNQSQKEKLELDLKREIKKLQRLRDQIKTWLGSNDVKDKTQLTENRKIIESEMERFKACEKEMKMKAYSKEGLSSSAKLDPREKEKLETSAFITSMLEELGRQTEALEAELDSLQVASRKSKRNATANQDRIADLNEFLERDRFHITQMELILRLLENGKLEPSKVNELQEDIKYYVESNQDPDFADDEGIYDELDLASDEVLASEVLGQDLIGVGGDDAEESNESGVGAGSGVSGASGVSRAVSGGAATASVPTAPQSAPATSNTPTASRKTSSAGAFTAAAQSPLTGGASNLKPAPAPVRPGELKYAAALSNGHVQTSSSASANPVNNSTGPQTPRTAPAAPQRPGTAPEPSAAADKPSTAAPAARKTTVGGDTKTSSAKKLSQDLLTLPPGLQVLISAYDAARNRVTKGPQKIGSVSRFLEQSFNCHFDLDDVAQQLLHRTPQRAVTTSELYPQVPIWLPKSIQDVGEDTGEKTGKADGSAAEAGAVKTDSKSGSEKEPKNKTKAVLESVQDFISRLGLDTLFYIFYYQQGTYEQYLAAKELKRQNWRFHKQFGTWFLPKGAPTAVTDTYEQGAYRYFEHRGYWGIREKENFVFELRYLENEF